MKQLLWLDVGEAAAQHTLVKFELGGSYAPELIVCRDAATAALIFGYLGSRVRLRLSEIVARAFTSVPANYAVAWRALLSKEACVHIVWISDGAFAYEIIPAVAFDDRTYGRIPIIWLGAS